MYGFELDSVLCFVCLRFGVIVCQRVRTLCSIDQFPQVGHRNLYLLLTHFGSARNEGLGGGGLKQVIVRSFEM